MKSLIDWLRHVANILASKAAWLEGLDADTKARVMWLKWRYGVVGAAMGFVVGLVAGGK
jgi:hypothetical protein